jgi:hypothetical protein
MGLLLMLFLRGASGATGTSSSCPPVSIAGSPNSLTTSRPAADASTAMPSAQCGKAALTAPKSPAPNVAAAPVASPAPLPQSAPSWKSVLEPLDAGGWKYISDGPAENPSSVFASSHAIMRNGNVITAWMRWEFARPQADVYPLHYLSAVTREELDCDARSYRRAEVVYYTGNNLQQKGPSFTALNDDTNWKQAIPGSEADAMLNWGCAAPAKPTAEKVSQIDKPDQPQKTDKSDKPAAAASSAPAAVSSAPGAPGGPAVKTAS